MGGVGAQIGCYIERMETTPQPQKNSALANTVKGAISQDSSLLRPSRGFIATVHSQLPAERGGKLMVSYLTDPNTRIYMYVPAGMQH